MRDWRRWASGALLLVFAGALYVHRHEVADAGREMTTLSPGWIAVLGLHAVAFILASGLLARAVSPPLSTRRGVMVQQATLAATNTGIGTGPIALGVRVSMLRSWGFDEVGIGIAVLGVNVVAALKLWVAGLAIALLGLTGVADGVIDRWVFWVVAGVSVGVLGATALVTWLVLRHPTPLRWIADRLDRLIHRAARRSRRLTRIADRIDLHHLVERFRVDAAELARMRGGRILAAGAAEQAVLVVLPLAIVRAFGIDAMVITAAQVLIAFVLVRLAASLTAIPGGIGITEIGLTAMLTRFGVADAPALAAVLTFRAVTFLLPIAVGGVCFGIWRRSLARRRATGQAVDATPGTTPDTVAA
jgi:putative heme transporter